MCAYSNDKGKKFEREIAEELNSYFKDSCGAKFRRTPSPERWKNLTRGDLNCQKLFTCGEGCPPQEFHWEITDRKNVQLINKWEKTQNDAKYRKPCLVWKKTGKAEGVIIRLKDFLSLLREVQEAREIK